MIWCMKSEWRAYIVNIRQNNMRLTSAPDSPEKRYYQTLGELIRSQFTREVNFAENEKIIEASREYINTESESVVSTDIINTNQVFNDLIVTTIRVHSLKTYSVAFAFTARNIAPSSFTRMRLILSKTNENCDDIQKVMCFNLSR